MLLFLLLALAMLHALADIGVARAEREGAVLARQVSELALLVQSHRSLSNQVAAGNPAVTASRDDLRARLRQAVQRTDDIVAETTLFSMDDLWPAERTRLLALADGHHAERRAEAIAAHGVQAERLHRLLKLIGERLHNALGQGVTLARLGGDADSATAQFFINTVDNAFLDRPQPDGAAYAVFGKVTKGMEVVEKIRKVKTTTKQGMGDVPVEHVMITKAEVLL